jgi:hypothetical protein
MNYSSLNHPDHSIPLLLGWINQSSKLAINRRNITDQNLSKNNFNFKMNQYSKITLFNFHKMYLT